MKKPLLTLTAFALTTALLAPLANASPHDHDPMLELEDAANAAEIKAQDAGKQGYEIEKKAPEKIEEPTQ